MKTIQNNKIIATIGPASKKDITINQLIKAGVDIFRFNLKHSTLNSHAKSIDTVRQEAKKLKQATQILLDLPSPSYFESLDLLLQKKPDYIALSYVKKASDIAKFKSFCAKNKIMARVVVKIETNEALNNFTEILKQVDCLMIARGDLGRSIPIEQVPFVQKEIVQACNKSKIMVIVATEMLLSMTSNKIPTRAEASDVANAVIDGGDAVMLSEETAIGKNPVEAVKTMHKIITEAKKWQAQGHLYIFSKNNKKFKFG